MRLLFATALTALLGLFAGALLGGFQAGAASDSLATRGVSLEDSAVRFALARGGSLGLLAGLALGGLHWMIRALAAAREGGKVRFGRIACGTIGFAFAAGLGAIAGGGLGMFFATLSPEWTTGALDIAGAADVPFSAAAIGAARGALLGSALYSLSALGAFRRRTPPPAQAPHPA